MNDSSEAFRSELLNSVSIWYSQWHGYVSLAVCAVGIPLNILNITVLTRKNLKTPINCVLTWLAVSDTTTMVSYVPFSLHFYCQFSAQSMSAEKNSEAWMTFLLIYLNFSATTHTVSIWLGVALAVFRYNHIRSPAKGYLTRMRRLIRARLAICITYVLSVVLMVPHYISYNLTEYKFSDNSTAFVFEPWNLGSKQAKPLVLVALLLYCIVAKLIPCVLIIMYGGFLLKTLNNKTMSKRRRRSENGNNASQRSRDTSRTTVMLLAVIVLFLITELPQGVLILCCILLENFFHNIYIPLGDAMDIIALINSSINFILYCTMSREFRKTFNTLFCSFTQTFGHDNLRESSGRRRKQSRSSITCSKLESV